MAADLVPSRRRPKLDPAAGGSRARVERGRWRLLLRTADPEHWWIGADRGFGGHRLEGGGAGFGGGDRGFVGGCAWKVEAQCLAAAARGRWR
jgi:hypothetical protein